MYSSKTCPNSWIFYSLDQWHGPSIREHHSMLIIEYQLQRFEISCCHFTSNMPALCHLCHLPIQLNRPSSIGIAIHVILVVWTFKSHIQLTMQFHIYYTVATQLPPLILGSSSCWLMKNPSVSYSSGVINKQPSTTISGRGCSRHLL